MNYGGVMFLCHTKTTLFVYAVLQHFSNWVGSQVEKTHPLLYLFGSKWSQNDATRSHILVVTHLQQPLWCCAGLEQFLWASEMALEVTSESLPLNERNHKWLSSHARATLEFCGGFWSSGLLDPQHPARQGGSWWQPAKTRWIMALVILRTAAPLEMPHCLYWCWL